MYRYDMTLLVQRDHQPPERIQVDCAAPSPLTARRFALERAWRQEYSVVRFLMIGPAPDNSKRSC